LLLGGELNELDPDPPQVRGYAIKKRNMPGLHGKGEGERESQDLHFQPEHVSDLNISILLNCERGKIYFFKNYPIF
jgi:hypothetical protein